MQLDAYYSKLLTRFDRRTAVRFGDRRLTYAEIDERTARLADVFRTMGLREDRRVAILVGNRPEFLVSEIAVARAGVIAIPTNSRLGAEHSKRIIRDVKADALIVDSWFFDVPKRLQQEHVSLKYIIGVAEDGDVPVGFQAYDELSKSGTPNPPSSPGARRVGAYTGAEVPKRRCGYSSRKPCASARAGCQARDSRSPKQEYINPLNVNGHTDDLS